MWHRPDNRGTELRRRLLRNRETQKKADQIGQPKLFVKNLFLVT